MSIISSLRTYRGKWNLVGSDKLDAEDKAAIKSAHVVNSQFGLSVCFNLVSGQYSYLPVSNMGRQPNIGEPVSLDSITVERLHRDGDVDIYRARIDLL